MHYNAGNPDALKQVQVTFSLQRFVLQKDTKPEEQRYFNNGIIPMCLCCFYLKFYTIRLFHFRILFHCTFSLSASFISVLPLCDFLLLSANLISRGYYDLVELA